MLEKFRTASFLQERNQRYCNLALTVLFAAGFGVLFAATSGHIYFHLMRMAGCRPVSIVGSFVTVFAPYFVSVLVVTNFNSWVTYMVIAVRIFLFAAAGYTINYCFDTAAWLVGFMFLFPDIFLIPVLIQLSLLRCQKAIRRNHTMFYLAYVVFIGIINFYTVSPFLAHLLNTHKSMGRYAIHVGLNWRI